MKIRDVLRVKGTEVTTIEPDKTVQEAICKLNEYGIGALVVTGESDSVNGIITERDILRECGENCVALGESSDREQPKCRSLVRHVMKTELIIGVPDDGLDYVMGIMTKNKIRHLPIMDGKKLAGIISIGDVINAHLKETEFENRTLKDYIHGVRL